ncbi:MAG: VOC family protein [Thermodesulfobacteriota bacterium]
MIAGIDHINIVTKDINQSVEFYTKHFNFKETGRKKLSGKWIENLTGLENIYAEVAFLVNDASDVKIEILKYFSPEGKTLTSNSLPNTPGLRHIAFKTDNFDKLIKNLQNSNVKFAGKVEKVPDPTDEYKIKICYFFDPDGTLVEITGHS